MEEWKKGIWATAGAGLVVVALASLGAWYLATGSISVNPFLISCGIGVLIGMYLLVAGLADGPLPGRAQARQKLAEDEKVEALKKERLIGIRNHLSQLIADARLLENEYMVSGHEPRDESLLIRWSNEASACISNIDVRLLPAFDQQRPPGRFCSDGRPDHQIIGLLQMRTAFLVQLQKDVGHLGRR